MKHILIVVGEDIKINDLFLNYIFSSYQKHFNELGVIAYIDDADKEMPFKIEKYSRQFEFITIIANERNFSTIAKILGTLISDNIELKQETLMPSRAVNFVKNSFVINLNKAQINALKATPTCKLPQFLLNYQKNSAFFYLLQTDKTSATALLDPLTFTYNVNIESTAILNNLVFVKVKAEKFGQLDGFLESVKNLFGYKMINNKNIVEYVGEILIKNSLNITFAESCTAGMCASMIGEIPGISGSFAGSVVTYSNHIKHTWLDVSDEILSTMGAVSEECVKQMCKGALELCKSDFSIAISGIAGPDGGSQHKPVGTVFIGVCDKNKVVVEKFIFNGDRNYIRSQSALSAFVMLISNFQELQIQ